MSGKCEHWLNISLYIVDLVVGIGLIIVGAYRFGTYPLKDPHAFFLSAYYVFFGSLLLLFLIFRSKIYFCFRLLSFPLGKSFFLLFLAALTLDITDIGRFIICLLLILGSILNAIYFLLFYVPDSKLPQNSKKPNKQQAKKANSPTFGKREIDDQIEVVPPADLAKNNKPDDSVLQRRS